MWRKASILLGAVAVVGVLWAVLYVLPGTLVDPGQDVERANAVTNARGNLITLLVAVGAAVTLYYTHKRHQLERDANRTDRYTKAVEQLASESVHIRLGGIYALERTARDSPADGQVITDVLCAFVREETATRSPIDDGAAGPAAIPPGRDADGGGESSTVDAAVRRTDTAAVLTVLGRKPLSRYRRTLTGADLTRADLTDADLTGAYLPEANLTRAGLIHADLTGVNLIGAKLTGARLISAKLTGANLMGADFTGGYLTGADFTGAYLSGAYLSGANLSRADLSGAYLSGADLTGANLSRAYLTRADLTGANLSGANLSRADLTGARLEGVTHSEGTRWPDGFTPPIPPASA